MSPYVTRLRSLFPHLLSAAFPIGSRITKEEPAIWIRGGMGIPYPVLGFNDQNGHSAIRCINDTSARKKSGEGVALQQTLNEKLIES